MPTNALYEEIAARLQAILTTIKGSDPLRPDFGSNICRYLDYPIDVVRARIQMEALSAIKTWERRVVVKSIKCEQAAHTLILTIEAENVQDGSGMTFSVSI